MDRGLLKQHLGLLCVTDTSEGELEALRSLHLDLLGNNISHNSNSLHAYHGDPDYIEKEYLSQSKTIMEEGNPYPNFQVTELPFPESIGLRDFVHYVFTRRYGWSEMMVADQSAMVQRIGKFGSYSKDEARIKSHLIELLDELIKWLLCHSLSEDILSAISYTVKQSTSHPVIRKQTHIHVLEWFRSRRSQLDEEFFEPCKELIVLGLTDVWSAIRSACASKLNAIIELLTFPQLEMFFHTLVQICKDEGGSWQAKEGAVMGLNVIVKRFQWSALPGHTSTSTADRVEGERYLMFGEHVLTSIPEFITSSLHDVVFLLLADPQLSIRENAIKTFSSYLSRCGLQEAMSSFSEVVSALCKGSGLVQQQVAKATKISSLLTLSGFTWMNAYLAEGLLGLCIFLVKHLPSKCILSDWLLCINIFSFYLIHPASTVRQTASKVIKFIVAKDTSNPAILKLVLLSLSAEWTVNSEMLAADCLPSNYTLLPESTQLYVNTNQVATSSITTLQTVHNSGVTVSSDEISATWQWKEGRLLAYELIFQFLIKNHWLYTFGVSSRPQTSSQDSSRPSSSASGQIKPLHTYAGASLSVTKSSSNTQNPLYNRSLNLDRTDDLLSVQSLPTAWPSQSHDRNHHSSTRADNLRPRICSHRGNHSPRLPAKRHPGTERSMPQPRMMLRRRATIDHLNPLSIAAAANVVNHSDTRPVNTAEKVDALQALPLITAVKHLEKVQNGKTAQADGDSTDSLWGNLTNICNLTDPESQHLTSKFLETTLSELLMEVLNQTVECLNNASWELKRMSQQVLPGLVEVIRWYDMSLLVDYWSTTITSDTSVSSYGAAVSFFLSVTHAARLLPFLSDPPDNWQDLKICKLEVSKVVDCMRAQLAIYIPMFVRILQRPAIDKLTVVAVQVILTSTTVVSPTSAWMSAAVGKAVDTVRAVTVLNNSCTKLLRYKPASMSNRILLASNGFLSCNPLDSDQLEVTVTNLQKYLLEHIHSLLPIFVRQTEVVSTFPLLPCLIRFLRGQYSSVHINKSFSDSAVTVFEKLEFLMADTSDESLDGKRKIYEIKNDSFYELILTITDKLVDKHVLHLALDCLASLLQHVDSQRFLLPLCKAVYSQLCTVQNSSSLTRTCWDDLEIMSNDIRHRSESPPHCDSSSEDEESILLDVNHQESLTLHNSGGTATSGRQSGLSQRSTGDISAGISLHSDGDSDSDWDSWDEEQEETNDKEPVFQEFLQRIYRYFQSQGRLEEFHKSLKKLATCEYRLLKAFLHDKT